MKQTVAYNDFVMAFHSHGRYDQFGGAGLRVLFDYLDGYENDTGEEIELDVIALCCEYAHSTVDELINDYDIPICDDDEAAKRVLVRAYLDENTFVCGETEDGIVYAQF